MDKDITHFDLCKKTCEWGIKKFSSNVGLYEFNTMYYRENPDVLLYGDTTKLFEIKVGRGDFLSDKKKWSRQKFKMPKHMPYQYEYRWDELDEKQKNEFRKKFGDENRYFIDMPHLGQKRYYVCPKDLIKPEETGPWGLYYFHKGRFYLKKESKKFKRNLQKEMLLLQVATRKIGNKNCNVLTKEYAEY